MSDLKKMVYMDVSVQTTKIKNFKIPKFNKGNGIILWCIFIIGNSSCCVVKLIHVLSFIKKGMKNL